MTSPGGRRPEWWVLTWLISAEETGGSGGGVCTPSRRGGRTCGLPATGARTPSVSAGRPCCAAENWRRSGLSRVRYTSGR